MDNQKLKIMRNKVQNLKGAKVLVVGDVMVDRYLHGDAERISPEAPVPVVLVASERILVGGAGNVARNIQSLTGTPYLMGVRGKDRDGDSLEKVLSQNCVAYSLVMTEDRPTTVKLRILARKQQMLRVDWENSEDLPWDVQKKVLANIERELKGAGAIVISDYSKGLVSSSFIQELTKLLKSSGCNIPVLVDPKPSNKDAYQGITLLTPNAKETQQMSGVHISGKNSVVRAGRKIMSDLRCPQLIITLGPDGMAVFCNDNEVWHIKTAAKEVFDVTGAGDTVIGVTALGLASGMSLLESAIIANYSAGIVVGQVGAGAVSPEELLFEVARGVDNGLSRWV